MAAPDPAAPAFELMRGVVDAPPSVLMTYARALAAAGFATIPRLTAAKADELVSCCRTPHCASSASVAHTDTFLRDLVHATRH